MAVAHHIAQKPRNVELMNICKCTRQKTVEFHLFERKIEQIHSWPWKMNAVSNIRLNLRL